LRNASKDRESDTKHEPTVRIDQRSELIVDEILDDT